MSFLSDILCDWYAAHGRDLPWRRTRDPYRIWLSEVILQQTRVSQGLDYYLRFTERYPDVGSLAAAAEDEVLKLWQGLGYYSRARNLHAAARQVVGEFGGRFPDSYDQVRRLRGVGDYTAAAICSAAFDAPCAVVDGNVYRVLARLFDLDTPVDTAAGRRLFADLSRELLDPARPGLCNQAIMDFGALQCTPSAPRCGDCPLADRCRALEAGSVAGRPVKRGRPKVVDRWFHYLDLDVRGRTLLRRRGAGDIWQGLWEFPLVETSGPTDFAELVLREDFRSLAGEGWRLCGSRVMPRHQLSHRTVHAVFHRIVPERLPAAEGFVCVERSRLGDYAVSRLTESYLEMPWPGADAAPARALPEGSEQEFAHVEGVEEQKDRTLRAVDASAAESEGGQQRQQGA